MCPLFSSNHQTKPLFIRLTLPVPQFRKSEYFFVFLASLLQCHPHGYGLCSPHTLRPAPARSRKNSQIQHKWWGVSAATEAENHRCPQSPPVQSQVQFGVRQIWITGQIYRMFTPRGKRTGCVNMHFDKGPMA